MCDLKYMDRETHNFFKRTYISLLFRSFINVSLINESAKKLHETTILCIIDKDNIIDKNVSLIKLLKRREIYVLLNKYTCICMYTCKHICIHVYMYMYMYVYVYER